MPRPRADGPLVRAWCTGTAGHRAVSVMATPCLQGTGTVMSLRDNGRCVHTHGVSCLRLAQIRQGSGERSDLVRAPGRPVRYSAAALLR